MATLKSAALSPESRRATACLPTAPGSGAGAVFCKVSKAQHQRHELVEGLHN